MPLYELPFWIMFKVARWGFQGQYLSSLSKNYVVINRDLEKLPPQLYWINMKICYDQRYNDSEVVRGNDLTLLLILLEAVFLGTAEMF